MTDQITEKSTCPRCGAEIPHDAPQGYCLNCLFALGTAESETVTTESPSHLSTPNLQPIPLRSFGDYELLGEIARGGMGIVYQARQKSLGRIVAIKMLLFGERSSKDLAQRFRAEAAVAASLQHPNIVAMHEVSAHEGQPFFVMDFIEGPSLARLNEECKVRNLEWLRRAARYVKIVAEAIDYAHERGVLHRDLKPSNVLIDPFDQPRVSDFGLAKRLHLDSELTLSGQVLGSPNYMPPEQAAAKRGLVGRRSDVYSLGAILYDLLTGRPPFTGATVTDTLQEVLNSEPISPRLLNPSVPPDLETLCLKCLEKEPARRYQTAQGLGEDLGRFLTDKPTHARPLGPAARLFRWSRRKPLIASLGGATLLLLLVLGIGSFIAAWRINKGLHRAELGELQAMQRAYAADMNRVQRALEVNDLGTALSYLDAYSPAHKPERTNSQAFRHSASHDPPDFRPFKYDLRGWEWRYLWKQCQSDVEFSLCRQPSHISSLSVSHDGKQLAVATHGSSVSVWDLATRQKVAHFPTEGEPRTAFSPTESLLVYSMQSAAIPAGSQYKICLRNEATKPVVTYLPLGGACRELAFSDDGRFLLTATYHGDHSATVWRLADKAPLYRCPIPEAGAFAVSRDLRVAAYAEGVEVNVIDLVTGQKLSKMEVRGEYVLSLAISPDGKMLASGPGYSESVIDLWEIASGKKVGGLEGHRAGIDQLVFWPDGKTLASASIDQTIRLWDVSDPAQTRSLGVLQGHRSQVLQVALFPDPTRLVSGSKDGEVCFWNTATTAAVLRERETATLPAKLIDWRFAPDSKSLLTVDVQGRVAQWRGTDFQEEVPLFVIRSKLDRVCISDDVRWFASSSTNGTVEVWDLDKRIRRSEFKAHTNQVGLGEFLAHGSKLMIIHVDDNSWHEWDLAAGREIRSWPDAPTKSSTVAFSPDEHWCLTLRSSRASSLIDLTTGQETHLNLGWYANASFSSDGRYFAAADWAGFATLRETATQREIRSFYGFLGGVHSVAFSPDGKRLAVGSIGRQAIKLWDLDGFQELLTLEGKGALSLYSAFSPDGNIFGALNDHGLLQLWRAPSWAEIKAAESTTK